MGIKYGLTFPFIFIGHICGCHRYLASDPQDLCGNARRILAKITNAKLIFDGCKRTVIRINIYSVICS
jgi:hypothetical protein